MPTHKLSKRSIAMLRACEHATCDKPVSGLSFSYAYHLCVKGLLKFRCFDHALGSGGHFITDKGRAVLREESHGDRAQGKEG